MILGLFSRLLEFSPVIYLLFVLLLGLVCKALPGLQALVVRARVSGFMGICGGLCLIATILYNMPLSNNNTVWSGHDFLWAASVMYILSCAVSWTNVVQAADKNPQKILSLGLTTGLVLIGALLALASRDFIQLAGGVIIFGAGIYGLLRVACESRSLCPGAFLRLYGVSLFFLMAGMVFVYMATKSFSFKEASDYLKVVEYGDVSWGLQGRILLFLGGSFFIFISLWILLGVFPFSGVVRSLYKDLPLSVSLFMMMAIPVLCLFLLVKLLWGPFIGYILETQIGLSRITEDFLIGLGSLTVLFGTVGSFRDSKIRSFLVTLGISFVGYFMISLGLRSSEGLETALFFMILFYLSLIGLWFCFYGIRLSKGIMLQRVFDFKELRGFNREHPYMGIGITGGLLSLACIPFFSLFWGKIYLVSTCFEENRWLLCLFILVMEALCFFSILTILKLLYKHQKKASFQIFIKSSTIFFIGLAIMSGIAYNACSSLYTEFIYKLTGGLLAGHGG